MVRFKGISIGVNGNEWDYENVSVDFEAVCNYAPLNGRNFVKIIIGNGVVHWIDWDKVDVFSLFDD